MAITNRAKRIMREKLQRQCDDFNSKYPIGTGCLVRTDGRGEISTRTRSQATVLEYHSAVIWLEGIPGCYALDRVTAFEEIPY